MTHKATSFPQAAAGAAPPLELTFQERYGDLEAHLWLDGGCLLAGFRSGQVAIVNVGPGSSACVRPGHSGTEVYSSRCGCASGCGLGTEGQVAKE